MKRKVLINKLTANGCVFVRHGNNHDLYKNQTTGKKQPIPRHREIDEHLARHIIKELT
ncbi:MAG: type II toxin-antitoxin system HicA family toxin [Gammaproteobacteria bacterium]|nr:type II toxin-antitoxin system HicA family toxin [Gammaproteobacteria bacterium]